MRKLEFGSNEKNLSHQRVAFFFILGIAALTGCSRTPDAASTEDPSAARQKINAQIQQIQNDPNMSPQLKQSTLEMLKKKQAGQ
jgi:outer membrane murein-binding lipoprotein Lpp